MGVLMWGCSAREAAQCPRSAALAKPAQCQCTAAQYTAQVGSKGPPPSVTNTEGGVPVIFGIRVDKMTEQCQIAGAGL